MVSVLNGRSRGRIGDNGKALTGVHVSVVFSRILFGERPYWWVHETAHYADGDRPHIEQYPMTCETGPGETPYMGPQVAYKST